MELTPKRFQVEALKRLQDFLSDAVLLDDPALAFAKHVEPGRGLPTNYTPLQGMEASPSVCLRVPTGGGKTMLAAMSLRRMADALAVDAPVALWLTPGKDVRSQTLRALQNPDHPYRRALWRDWGDRLAVYDIAEFDRITPQDLRGRLTIIVCTRQALQVENTEGRRVYADNENLEGHFTAAALRTPGLELTDAAGPFPGRPRYSFVNLLRVHRPLVIVDEAHQFVTGLAFAVRQRIGARALVEFTATPAPPSNVLLSVSASQLRMDKLIKLPVVVAEHTGAWQSAVTEAVAKRKHLYQLARSEPDYVRPLLLIQAQNEGQAGDWRAVKQFLLEGERLDPAEVAVHTGAVRELEGVDLFRRDCPITTILTVQALKEGWDCSFASVLCSTANIGAAGDVEQWLGRVLRMPYARERRNPELNRAYVHAAAERFHLTVDAVKQSLQGMGFEEWEARTAVVNRQGDLPLFQDPFHVTVSEAPDLWEVARADAATVTLAPAAMGQVAVTVEGPLSPALQNAVLARVAPEEQAAVTEQIRAHNRQFELSPAQRGVPFRVPRLTVEEPESGERLLFTDEVVDEFVHIDLREHAETLSGFRYEEATRLYVVDLAGEHLNLNLLGETEAGFTQPVLAEAMPSRVQLVRELASRLTQTWLLQREMDAWVLHAIEAREAAGHSLDVLYRARFVLLRMLRDSLERIRQDERTRAVQELLFASDTSALTLADEEFAFRYGSQYLPVSWCTSTAFQHHYYARVGELKNTGDEYYCAVELDQLPSMRHWVRNLAGKHHQYDSFWLQTQGDRFYPDFVAQLEDGRTLVVEYKGGMLANNPEELHKKRVGELWAERSGGRALFVWATGDAEHVRGQLRGAAR